MIKQKKKGTDFERLAVEILNKLVNKSNWRRIPGSGAIGTIFGEPILQGDITGKLESFQNEFKAEAKVGYGGAKQISLKKEWLDKIIEESRNNSSIPFLIGKFSGSKSGVKVFVAMDVETFSSILNRVTMLDEELRKLQNGTSK